VKANCQSLHAIAYIKTKRLNMIATAGMKYVDKGHNSKTVSGVECNQLDLL